MEKWKTVRIEDVTTVLGDGLHGTPKYAIDGEYAFINGNNLENGRIVIKKGTKKVDLSQYEMYKKPLNDRTLLVSINGTLGNVAEYHNEKIILGKSACYFNVRTDIDKDFIRYIISSPIFRRYLESVATGTTIKNISLKQIREYEFQIPDRNLQKKISSILKQIDNKINTNYAINENLADQIQAIYSNEFDSTTHTPSGVLADICSYSSDRIPVSGLSLSTYFSTENMQPNKMGSVDATSLPSITQTTRCHKGDVLISNIRPYFKKIVYVTDDSCGCSTDVLCFVPKEDQYSAFLFGTLYMDRFFDYMVAGSKGTKMPRGDKQQIMNYPVVLPNKESLNLFNELIVPMLDQIATNRIESSRLAALRDALLPKLISGELNVSDIDL